MNSLAEELHSAIALDVIAEQINAEHREAQGAFSLAVEHAMRAGRLLDEAKAAVPHGEWQAWLSENCEFSDRTARLYMRLAREVPKLPDQDRQRVAIISLREAAKAVAGVGTLSVMFSSRSSEHHTPPNIIERAQATMGAIDLDPCITAASAIPAATKYTKADDGLSKRWTGRVYMNPPYGRSIPEWVGKLVEDYEAGHVSEAIALVPSRTDTAWFALLDEFPRCHVRGRLTFSEADSPAPFPSAVFYLGKHVERFTAAFADVGAVFVRLAP